MAVSHAVMETFTSTEVRLVAFDICAFSRGLTNPTQLLSEHRKLVEAVHATPLVHRCLQKDQIKGQFLGDELRLAFLASEVSPQEIRDFASTVFRGLEAAPWAPQIRGTMVEGTIQYQLHPRLKCTYFSGPAALEMDKLLPQVADGTFLMGPEPIRSNVTSPPKIATPFSSTADTKDAFVLGIAATSPSYTLRAVADILSDGVDRLDGENEDLLFSAGPRGFLVLLPDSTLGRTLKVLRGVQAAAESNPTPFDIAVSIWHGPIWNIRAVDARLFSPNFGGPAPIIAARLLAKCAPGQLIWQAKLSEHMPDIARSGVSKELPGKRDEKFSVVTLPDYFGPTNAATKSTESSAPSASVPKTREPAQRAIATFLTDIGWTNHQAPIATQLAALPLRVLQSVHNALAGLAAVGIVVPDVALSNIDTHSGKHLLAHAAHAVVSEEFTVWKQFHSLGGELARHCTEFCEHFTKLGNREPQQLHDLREQIRLSMRSHGRWSSETVEQLVTRLHTKGYIPLVARCERLTSTSGQVASTTSLSADDFSDFVEWAGKFDVLVDAMARRDTQVVSALKQVEERLSHAASLGSSKLNDLLLTRAGALKLSLHFVAALRAANVLLGLSESTWRPDKVPGTAKRSLSEVRVELAGGPERLVKETNNVLFAWIKLFADV